MAARAQGAVEFLPSELERGGTPHTPKVMPVKIVVHQECKDVPMVLADWCEPILRAGHVPQTERLGNFKAIDSVAKRRRKGRTLGSRAKRARSTNRVLGIHRTGNPSGKGVRGTRVLRSGLRGGRLKDIDLFAYKRWREARPDGTASSGGRKRLRAGEALGKRMECPPAADCLVGLG